MFFLNDDIFMQKNVAYFNRYGFNEFSCILIVQAVNDEKAECLKMPLP